MSGLSFIAVIFAIAARSLLASEPRAEMQLSEALVLAEKSHPRVEASRNREAATLHTIESARSAYFPHIDLEVIDSTGFPGSSGLTGIGGLMGSPYRSGLAGGLVVEQDVWDFGRTGWKVQVARQAHEAVQEESKVVLSEIFRDTATAFFECSRFRNHLDSWERTGKEAASVAKEVAHFVRTGQRSVVDRYLAQSQAEEAEQEIAGNRAKLQAATERLALLTGRPVGEIRCPLLPDWHDYSVSAVEAGVSPLVTRAVKASETALAHVSQAKAEHLPRLVAVASVGEMERARLVGKQEYAIGGGLIFPLFDGWRTTSEVERARAGAEEKESEVKAARLELQVQNNKYDQVILSSRARLEHLDHEFKLGQEGFALAKKRYFRFEGTLVDIRETLRNLARTETQLNDARADLFEALQSKHFLNGAREPIPAGH
jgi:outer membrane protein TolC